MAALTIAAASGGGVCGYATVEITIQKILKAIRIVPCIELGVLNVTSDHGHAEGAVIMFFT